MAIETFHTLIARNKRNSVFLMAGFFVFFVAMGLLIGAVWGGGDMTFSVIVAAVAAGVAFIMMLFSYYGGASAVLGIARAKEIVKSDDPQLFTVVEELAIAAGTPMPKVYLIDEDAPNAFATGRNPERASVAITRGLMEKLDRDELQGVMAHELSHVRNYDIRMAMLMAVMVGAMVLLCDVFLRSMWWGGGRRRRGSREGGGALQIILLVVGLLLAILAPLLARMIQMAMSRQREYLADASAVELTRNPEGLAGALAKISGDPEVLEVANRATAHMYIVHPIKQFEKRASGMFDSHPPTRERVARLMSLAT